MVQNKKEEINQIGEVSKLFRYPVKSMKGIEENELYISYSGVVGDRLCAFVRSEDKGSFPWLTARQAPEMILYETAFTNPTINDESYVRDGLEKNSVTVTTPEGEKYDIESIELINHLSQKYNKDIFLRKSEAGMQDSRPVSIFNLKSLSKLEQETDLEIDMLQFRMNIYADFIFDAFQEEELLNRKIMIGDTLELEINKKDARCKIITLNPKNAVANPALHAHIAKEHENCAGIYAVVLREGLVKLNDPIYLID